MTNVRLKLALTVDLACAGAVCAQQVLQERNMKHHKKLQRLRILRYVRRATRESAGNYIIS